MRRKENERNTMMEEIGELKTSLHIPIARKSFEVAQH
jgi:chorismate mutase